MAAKLPPPGGKRFTLFDAQALWANILANGIWVVLQPLISHFTPYVLGRKLVIGVMVGLTVALNGYRIGVLIPKRNHFGSHRWHYVDFALFSLVSVFSAGAIMYAAQPRNPAKLWSISDPIEETVGAVLKQRASVADRIRDTGYHYTQVSVNCYLRGHDGILQYVMQGKPGGKGNPNGPPSLVFSNFLETPMQKLHEQLVFDVLDSNLNVSRTKEPQLENTKTGISLVSYVGFENDFLYRRTLCGPCSMLRDHDVFVLDLTPFVNLKASSFVVNFASADTVSSVEILGIEVANQKNWGGVRFVPAPVLKGTTDAREVSQVVFHKSLTEYVPGQPKVVSSWIVDLANDNPRQYVVSFVRSKGPN